MELFRHEILGVDSQFVYDRHTGNARDTSLNHKEYFASIPPHLSASLPLRIEYFSSHNVNIHTQFCSPIFVSYDFF